LILKALLLASQLPFEIWRTNRGKMRLPLKKLLLAFVVLLAVIQLYRPARTNPPIDAARAISATLVDEPAVAAIFERSCNDCHSHRTVWPWYSKVAPASWLVAYDVNEGRKKMNFSEWTGYSPQEKQKLLEKICKDASQGEMPELQYSLIHPSSKLAAGDVQALCDWTQVAGQRISAEAGAAVQGR
jgi:hypothetical protein